MTKLFPILSRLSLVAFVAALTAHGEDPSVARALGLKSKEAAAAIESGSGKAWNRNERDEDPVVQKMNVETSVFLRNAPRAEDTASVVKPYQAGRPDRDQRKIQADEERDFALQQLEFRQNVEGAMKQILSFSPSIRGAGQDSPDVGEGGNQIETRPPGPRDRLIQAAVGPSSPFRSLDVGREAQPEARQVYAPEVDERVPSASFEASSEDDEGKPVRVGVSGDFGGAESPVISMRRGSRKVNPAAIPRLPALRDVNGSDVLVKVPPLPLGVSFPSIPDGRAHYR